MGYDYRIITGLMILKTMKTLLGMGYPVADRLYTHNESYRGKARWRMSIFASLLPLYEYTC